MHKQKPLLLFDFDGVLVDSFACAFSVCKQLYPGTTEKQYRKMFEGNIYESAAKARPDIAWKDRQDRWFKLYTPKLLALPPVADMLDVVHDLHRDYRLVIVSSSIESPIHQYAELHGITKRFDYVFGADTHFSKVEKIKLCFERFAHTPDESLFITDTLGDIREAAQAGVRSVAVTWGFHDKATLQRGNPAAIVTTPQTLKESIRQLLPAIPF